MWLRILISYLCLINVSIRSELTGDHVCQQEEKYAVNVTEYFMRNVTIRSYQWCMQVPPRCSTFSTKVINDSRVVERDEFRVINICCNGFIADLSEEKCIRECGKCINGKCNDENKCYCNPGFRGDRCSKECESSRWGRYCRYDCACERGKCDPETGSCSCPPGWTGSRCELQCQVGYFGEQCKGRCNCKIEEICNNANGYCTLNEIDTIVTLQAEATTKRNYNRIKIEPSLKKYHTFDATTLKDGIRKSNRLDKKVDLYFLTTTELPITTEIIKSMKIVNTDMIQINEEKIENLNEDLGIGDSSTTGISIDLSINRNVLVELDKNMFDNGMNDSTSRIHNVSTPITDDSLITTMAKFAETTEATTMVASHVMSTYEDINFKEEHVDVNIKSSDPRQKQQQQQQQHGSSVVLEQITKSPLATTILLKGKVDDGSEVTGTTRFSLLLPEETWLNDDSQLEVIHRDHSATSNGLVFSATMIATAAGTLVILITALYLVLMRIRKPRPKSNSIQSNESAANGVMSTVVTTRSIFHTPLPELPTFDNQVFNTPKDNPQTAIETQIICSLNVRTPATQYASTNEPELFYDHPPSTGSYRAASVPEPTNDYKLLEISDTNTMEPLYDEIPCWTQPVVRADDYDTMYMNTINENKTRF